MKMRGAIIITIIVLCTVVRSIASDSVVVARKGASNVTNLDNYIIQLQGTYLDSTPLDLLLTGSGPEFSMDLSTPRLSFRATLQPDGDRICITYQVSASTLIQMSTRSVAGSLSSKAEQAPHFESYRTGVTGSAVLSSGKPLVIVAVNQNKLELTVTKSTEEVSPRK